MEYDKIFFQTSTVDGLRRVAAEFGEITALCVIFYNGVGMVLDLNSVQSFWNLFNSIETNSFEVDSVHEQFKRLLCLFRQTKLASSSIVWSLFHSKQDKLVRRLLPTIQVFLPTLLTVSDVVDFFTKYVYTMVHLRGYHVDDDKFGFCVIANADKFSRHDTMYFCSNPPCSKTANRVCYYCKVERYCCVDCQRADWPDHKRNCFANPANVGFASCMKPGCNERGVSKCSRCNEMLYCSRKCQVDHWSIHKHTCTKPVVDA